MTNQSNHAVASPEQVANAIRALSMDAVQHANSGHPGMPMGMAEIAVALWTRHLKHSPVNPMWADRDRFVLSNGHGSMLLYSMLHLSGYDLGIDDIKKFRQLGSRTPGHPELGYTPGVETTTGPLGQGIANAVGMAIAEKLLADEFNKPGLPIVDHHTYAFLGDGCLMEGISHEVCSLAGTLGLGKLVVLYDDNGISIDGHIEGWFTDNTPKRFEAYGWNVIGPVNGHDVDVVANAIQSAKSQSSRPTLICCKTTIVKGSPNKADSHDCHGSPLGATEIEATRKSISWSHDAFEVPAEVYAACDAKRVGAASEQKWIELYDRYAAEFPDMATAFRRRMAGKLPSNFEEIAQSALADVQAKAETIATRKASQNAIQALAPHLPELIGGSADLASSNLTFWKEARGVGSTSGGNYIYYGVREFGMAAIMNGLHCHGGFRTFGGTFLMFSEYARNALRMAALMKLNPIYVFTHDSIALGQDGPTHQPIEQIATLRMVPNMDVWRPCDTTETMIAWKVALAHRSTPTCLVLSRQNLAFQERSAEQLQSVSKGGYVLKEAAGDLHLVIIATGSEVELAVKAQQILAAQSVHARVVSMPSTKLFDQQTRAYRAEVLGEGIPRLAIEAGVTDFWRKYVGLEGGVIGIDTFGESAPPEALFNHFGVTVDRVVEEAMRLVAVPRTSVL